MGRLWSLHSLSPPSFASHLSDCDSNNGNVIALKTDKFACREDAGTTAVHRRKSRLRTTFARTQAIGRREASLQLALISVAIPNSLSTALAANEETGIAAEEFRVYADEKNKFQISVPNDWEIGSGNDSGFKSLTAFHPQGTTTSNVSVVITGLGPDFTTMGSFGKVEAFAETLIGGLDRSWQRPPGVAAKLIDCKASKGMYFIEYTLQNPGEEKKHLLSVLGIAFNGWYNQLYTVTGQFGDEDEKKYASKVRKAVSSFSFL